MLNEIKFASIVILQELSKHLTISSTEIFYLLINKTSL